MTRRAPTPIGDDHDWLKQSLRRATDNAYHLYDGEITFVDQLREKCSRFGEGTYVSAKQRAWLKRIMARLDRMGIGEDDDEPSDSVARPVDEVMKSCEYRPSGRVPGGRADRDPAARPQQASTWSATPLLGGLVPGEAHSSGVCSSAGRRFRRDHPGGDDRPL